MLFSSQIPGVDLSTERKNIVAEKRLTAVPIFMGYTEKKPESSALLMIDSFAQFEDQFGGRVDVDSSTDMKELIFYFALKHFFDNGGEHCYIYSLSLYNEVTSIDDAYSGLTVDKIKNAIKVINDATLLTFPDSVIFNDNQITEIWAMLLDCASDLQLFCLLDPPATANRTINCLNNLSSENNSFGAVYWPKLVTNYSNVANENVILPASTAIAAIMGINDEENGIWTACANRPINQVLNTEYGCEAEGFSSLPFTDNNKSNCNFIKANPLTNDYMIWGTRTLKQLEGDSPNRNIVDAYLHLKRLKLYIHRSINEICRFAIFEENSQITWAKLEIALNLWLSELWEQGALAGESENQAYRVSVGLNQTMTEVNVRNGQIIIEVGVAFTAPAEFIDFRIELNTQVS